jgi:GGDEF domain-containing protein
LISIRKAADDIDRLSETMNAAKATYIHALRSTAQYTLELDVAESESFRDRLEGIRGQAEAASHPEDWFAIQASFRGELREHRDRSMLQLAKLRAEMKMAAEAMEIFAESVVTSGLDHKEGLQDALAKLDGVIREESIAKVRHALIETKAQIGNSIDRMEREHGMIVAQLRDEIRSLHRQIDADRRALSTDGSTGVWNRQTLHAHMEDMLNRGESFCVLVVSIRNLRRLDQRHSPAVIESGVKALLQRLMAILGDNTMVGRWSEEVFAVILQIDPAAAIALSRQASKTLSGIYSVQENGNSRKLELSAVAGVIERQPSMEPASFHKKLLQMAEVLSTA